jgi:hypothetical protein
MNQKMMSVGTIMVIIGIALSVGASYGLIKEAWTFKKALSFHSQGWTEAVQLAEFEMERRQIVTIELTELAHAPTSFSVYCENDFGYLLAERSFTYNPFESGWDPDIRNPVFLFEAQTPGKCTVYASPILAPEEYVGRECTFQVVVTNPPPYTIMLILGIVMIALGIVAFIYSILFRR